MAATPYQTGFIAWKASKGEFKEWELNGTRLAPDGQLVIDPSAAAFETDPMPFMEGGISFYNGGAFRVGEAISPVITSPFPLDELVPSWNADTPTGAWLEVGLRVRVGERWTGCYNLGVWAADTTTFSRHSVANQTDADASVSTDTLIVQSNSDTLAFQMRLRLFSADGVQTPAVRMASVAFSSPRPITPELKPGNPRYWNKHILVQECSQMIYPDGGNVWCSPTSLAMVFGYWGWNAGREERVRPSVAGVYDHVYQGHGNWSFNAAYAGARGFDAYVLRVTSLAELEPWIAADVPVVVSFGWREGQLRGAAIPSSNGHLAVLVGFDSAGNPIINAPAAPSDDGVCRTYDRREWETLFLSRAGGTVYIIHKPGWLPAA